MSEIDEIFDTGKKEVAPEADSEEAGSAAMAPGDPAAEYCVDQLDREKIRVFDSEILARGRHKDYDSVVSDVVAAAKKDENLALEIVSAADPAEHAYKLGRRLREGNLDDVFDNAPLYKGKGIDQW